MVKFYVLCFLWLINSVVGGFTDLVGQLVIYGNLEFRINDNYDRDMTKIYFGYLLLTRV